jgi:DNA-binding transcriptional MerR regulator
MRIGELSRRTGASPRMLRYYEDQGLIASTRTAGGQREYDDGEPDRVSVVRSLLEAGLSSRTIGEVLPCSDRPSLRTSIDAHAAMSRERERLDASIEQLVRAREALDRLLATNEEHRVGLLEHDVALV